MTFPRRGVLAAALVAVGCTSAPRYAAPATPQPPAYKEAGPWVAAAPAGATARGDWWERFGDPVLDGLEARIEAGSPSLAAALARRAQAAAVLRGTRAQLVPEIDLAPRVARQRVAAGRPLDTANRSVTYDDYVLGGTLSYEVDLWGRIGDQVRAARADVQAGAADVADVRLSQQASLADAYLRLRGLDEEGELLRQTVAAYTRAFALTDTRHSGGIASGLDVSRARAQLATARAATSEVASDRAAIEHAIAALIGVDASSFGIAPATLRIPPPVVPIAAPSLLVQRRPDVAAAERRVFAASERVGVARAALFPRLTLGLSGGFEATGGGLLAASNLFWALGPAALLAPLIDGGRRRAEVRRARAVLEEAAADYRSTVLAAFRQVEDELAAIHHLGTEARDQRDAVQAAERTRDLAQIRYRDGASDYLDVVTAQTAALDAERAELQLHTRQLQAVVDLVRALGGDVAAGG